MSARELITEHLDLWTGAVTKKSSSGRGSNGKVQLTGVRKLRQLILRLAVIGQLVEQDADDEPTKKLIERIYSEDDNGRSRLSHVHQNEKTTNLPIGWDLAFLPEVTENKKYAIKRGPFGSALKKAFFKPSGFKVYEQQHAINNDFARGNYYINEEKFAELKAFEVSPGDLIISCSGTVGCVAEAPNWMEPGIINQALLKLSLDQRLLTNDYFKILFPAFFLETETLKNLQGTAQKNMVSMETLKKEPFPMPPIEEQHRIVQKVDELMALCDRLEQQTSDQLEAHETLVGTLLGTLTQSENATDLADNWVRLADHFDTLFTTEQSIDKLKQTILQLAVMGRLVDQKRGKMDTNSLLHEITLTKKRLIDQGKLKKQRTLPAILDEEKTRPIPASWEWVRLQDVIDVRDGTHDSPKSATGPDTYPLVTSKDFRDGQIDFSNAKRISEEDHRLISQRSLVEPDDILFSMIGGNIGNQVIVNTPEKFSVKNVALFKYYDNTLTVPRFLKIFTEDLANSLQDQASGGAQPFVSLGKLRNLPFPLPPVEEQHCIVQKVDELMALCDQLKERLHQASETRCHLAEAVVEKGLSA